MLQLTKVSDSCQLIVVYNVTYLPLAGVSSPVGVLGREPPLGVLAPSLLAVAAARATDALVLVTLRIGMRDGVETSSKINHCTFLNKKKILKDFFLLNMTYRCYLKKDLIRA